MHGRPFEQRSHIKGSISDGLSPDNHDPSDSSAPVDRHATNSSLVRFELAFSIALAVIGAAVVLYAARAWWFHDDAWDFLTLRGSELPLSILRPHSGHWQTPTVLAYLAIGAVVGMKFWPVYFLPRVVGYAGWSWWLWRVLRIRNTHRGAALAFLALSLVLSVSAWHDLSTIGNLIVLSVALKVALMAATQPESRSRFRGHLVGLLILAVASSSLGVSLLIGSTAAAIVSKERLRLWWPSLLGAYVTYATWYILFSNTTPSGFRISDVLRSAPRLAFIVVQEAAEELTRNNILAPFFVIGIVGLILWLAFRRTLDGFDWVLIFTFGAFLSMIVVFRLLPGLAAPTATRYAQNTVFLLAPVLLPKLAPTKAQVRSLVVAVLIVLVVPAHWLTLTTRIHFWEKRSQASMQVVTSAAFLMREGEPWAPGGPVDFPRAGVLSTGRLDELVAGGWDPPISADTVAVERARFDLRVVLRRTGQPSDELPTILQGTRIENCVQSDDGEAIVLEVSRQVVLRVTADQLPIEIQWADSYGRGSRMIGPRARLNSSFVLRTIDPADAAQLTVKSNSSDSLTVCARE